MHRFERPIESYSRIRLALVAITALVAVIAVTLTLGKLSPGQRQYRAEFAQAASIRAGDQVTVAGIQVGTVRGLHLAADRVVVTFKVNRAVHVGAESHAAIKLTTLLGSRYLELSPALTGELTNGTIGLANTVVPYDLQQTLADATTTFEQVDANRIADSLTALSRSLTGVPEVLPQALNNLKSLSSIIAGRRDQIGTLLSSTDDVVTMIRNQKSALGSMIVQGRNLLAQLANRRAAVERLFASATTLVTQAKTILADEPSINALLAQLQDFMAKTRTHDAFLRSILQLSPVAWRDFINASGGAPAFNIALPGGPFIDSWMCAISARNKQFNFPQYFQDCAPVPDPYPGWPPPDPNAVGFPGFPPEMNLPHSDPATAPAPPAPQTPGEP